MLCERLNHPEPRTPNPVRGAAASDAAGRSPPHMPPARVEPRLAGFGAELKAAQERGAR